MIIDINRKVAIIADEMMETCFALNDHACKTALDGDCPRSTCTTSFKGSALIAIRRIEKETI